METPVQVWDVDTDAQGPAPQQLRGLAGRAVPAVYRLTDAKGHTIEGGYLFTVIGNGFDGSEFRFNDLELIPDRREYQPGDKVRLMVNTDRPGGTVLLFLRPANGVYLPPKLLHLQGRAPWRRSTVAQKDMPNFFVEALTVADGRALYRSASEIVVPPEQRVLNVEVMPSAADVQAGPEGHGAVQADRLLRQAVRGLDRRGDLRQVAGIHLRRLERAGDQEFFWKWRRQHYPQHRNQPARAAAAT